MPAVTRSAARRNGYRSRIEDPTPDSCIETSLRRSGPQSLRTAVKRKLAVCRENCDDEPTRKKYANRLRSAPTTEKFSSTYQKSRHVETNTENLKRREISTRHFPSRIPKRSVATRSTVNNKATPARNVAVKGNTTKGKNRGKENISDNIDRLSDESDYSTNENNNTPGCEMNNGADAARLKTYSAICRSKKKKAKKKGQNKSIEMTAESESPKSSLCQSTQKSKEEGNQEGENQNGSCEDGEVINKEMFNCEDEKEVDESLPDAPGQDEQSYKTKYLEMVSRMKTLQDKFLEAQQNALRNSKVSDSFISQLQITLEKALQNVTSAREECQKREKEMDKLKRTLAQLQEVSRENKDLEKTYVSDQSFDEEKLDGLKRKLKEERAILKFYSVLTGISVTQDESHLTNSKYESFHCEYLPENSNKHAVRFRLMYDKEVDELEYCPNPKSPGSEQLMTHLPEYLQENIFFLPNQAPRFLSKLLRNVEKM